VPQPWSSSTASTSRPAGTSSENAAYKEFVIVQSRAGAYTLSATTTAHSPGPLLTALPCSGCWPIDIGGQASLPARNLAIYLQHVLFHAVPVLRRLHRTHHAARRFAASPAL
jgi:sterol desaturase/sphingolipid hydroxylase (fatty acid hydroxylase superfamily)